MPNIVLVKSSDLIINRLFFIYRASLEYAFYHDEWCNSTTLILRKPGCAAYDIAKSYRPIGLLNTIGKLLSTLIAADLSFLIEKHQLLPRNQFRGRPGCTTIDVIHLLTAKIKDAWRKGQVAMALFLDVQAAFPNTVKSRLLHNLQCARVPTAYVHLAEEMLSNCTTFLSFDDFISTNPISIVNDTTQGCPLSMTYYSFYNMPLIDSALYDNEMVIDFVDDCTLLATGPTLDDTHRTIRNMMERTDSCFAWSISHNSPFELSKFTAIDFPRRHSKPPTHPLTITKTNLDGSISLQTISPSSFHHFLGVLIDSKLRWKEQKHRTVSQAVLWSNQVRHLARMNGGIPPSKMQQLYIAVAVPKFTYAADIWYTPPQFLPTSTRKIGSVAVTKKLMSVQRRAALAITEAMNTTARDIVEVHANLLPIPLLLDKIHFRAATRLASMPPSHPLYPFIRRANRHYVRHHCASIHHLLH